jgi:hypothetical protein
MVSSDDLSLTLAGLNFSHNSTILIPRWINSEPLQIVRGRQAGFWRSCRVVILNDKICGVLTRVLPQFRELFEAESDGIRLLVARGVERE